MCYALHSDNHWGAASCHVSTWLGRSDGIESVMSNSPRHRGLNTDTAGDGPHHLITCLHSVFFNAALFVSQHYHCVDPWTFTDGTCLLYTKIKTAPHTLLDKSFNLMIQGKTEIKLSKSTTKRQIIRLVCIFSLDLHF